MKTTIHLVRHGEVYNPHKVIYGRLAGFGLSEQGKKEAQILAHHLKGNRIAAIYASPLTRAQETASYIAQQFSGLTVATDERLIEVFSPIDGKPNSIMFARDWNFYTKDLLAQGGESLSEIWQRLESFFLDVAAKHAGREIVAVSHGDPIMIAKTKGMRSRLTVPNMRKDYVGHASGVSLIVENNVVVYVSPIKPQQ